MNETLALDILKLIKEEFYEDSIFARLEVLLNEYSIGYLHVLVSISNINYFEINNRMKEWSKQINLGYINFSLVTHNYDARHSTVNAEITISVPLDKLQEFKNKLRSITSKNS